MKRIAVLQSNYIPWKGYFDIINSVDEFVIYDKAQYTRRDWRNRNIIKSRYGPMWLTIPVKSKGKFTQAVCETEVDGESWAEIHFKKICHNYGSSLYFNKYRDIFRDLYLTVQKLKLLSQINKQFINVINATLGIKTKISDCSDYEYGGNKTEKLICICKEAGAEEYITGPNARTYLDTLKFEASGIRIDWMDYSGYPEYNQLHPPFNHNVSIIDLIFNEGPEAKSFMKSF